VNSNLELLVAVAEALGETKERLVFVGGCATGLLVTDAGAAPVRATNDVDAIVAITSMAGYRELGKELINRGFTQKLADGDPPYRWTYAGLKLDLMPLDEAVLGFSNRWYRLAMESAVVTDLGAGLNVRVVNAPCFIATKLEAFRSRGRTDYLASPDLEDIITVVDGRPELVNEVRGCVAELRAYIGEELSALLNAPDFLNALPGLVMEGSPAGRLPVVLERLNAMAKSGT
jgi:predicted nucleotidyltransferase